jgi:flavin-dependent thymidylate synthase
MNDQPIRWGDAQQYGAEPHSNFEEGRGVLPSVTLLWMTPKPLQAIGAMCAMYEGRVVRHIDDMSREDSERYFADAMATHLKAPLEAVQFHFMIEGVDRSFTHQMVRQRTAVFAQESLRFAVPGRLAEAHVRPPTLQPNAKGELSTVQQRWGQAWDNAIETIDAVYHMLVETGMPAEEARGILPHAVATRLNFNTNLRNLADHAGNRLCTQAQFHWRMVFAQMIAAIRAVGYGTEDEWQYRMLADSGMFRPVCYAEGRCPFKAGFDRACSIRERMDTGRADEVRPEEWLMDPTAARTFR